MEIEQNTEPPPGAPASRISPEMPTNIIKLADRPDKRDSARRRRLTPAQRETILRILNTPTVPKRRRPRRSADRPSGPAQRETSVSPEERDTIKQMLLKQLRDAPPPLALHYRALVAGLRAVLPASAFTILAAVAGLAFHVYQLNQDLDEAERGTE